MRKILFFAAAAALLWSCGSNETKTESGLLINKTLVKADSEKPKPGDFILAHYTGTLKEGGKKFDSSKDRNQPIGFVLGKGQVIKGWEEGFTYLGVGEKAILTIPPDLAYGNQMIGDSANPVIPPNSTLVFDVELVEIVRYNFELTQKNEAGKTPKEGDAVVVLFTGSYNSNRPFNSPRSEEGKGYRFRIGSQGASFPALDSAVKMMKVGEKAKVRFTPKEAPFLQGEYVNIELELRDVIDLSFVAPFQTDNIKPVVTDDKIQIFKTFSANGPQPAEQDTVVLHMSMFLESGRLLFSTYESGDSIAYPLVESIFPKGLVKAITKLKAGEKAKVILPYQLAYGENGGGNIPPRSNIVYNVELLGTKKAKPGAKKDNELIFQPSTR
jgi:FKBP-type peptidyl-prolyl cis-trans isomerase